jgi:transcriptional regulator with XRE-family HTH domain
MNRIRQTREAQGLRLVDLAKKSGVSLSWLWLLENGYDERASQRIKVKLARALRLTLKDLFPKNN